MGVESFSLFESGSTMPHRGIALPPRLLLFGDEVLLSAALHIPQRISNRLRRHLTHFVLAGLNTI